MGRYSSGGTLPKVRSGAIILMCVLSISLSSISSPAYGLSVDPLLDRVLSVTQLNETQAVPQTNSGQSLGRSDDKARPVTAKAPSHNGTPLQVNEPVTTQVVTEPLEVLPPLDTFDRQQRIARFSAPVTKAAGSPVTLPVASGSAPASILRSSEHGWKIFGVAWYVWGLAGVSSAYATRWVLSRR